MIQCNVVFKGFTVLSANFADSFDGGPIVGLISSFLGVLVFVTPWQAWSR